MMNTDNNYFIGRIWDMARDACDRCCYIYSDFLTPAEQSDVLSLERELPAEVRFFGGYAEAERRMARFAPKEGTGYEEDFPIIVLRVSPVNPKFADALTHRDFLGAVLNLGIDRKVTGDILTGGADGYIFAASHIAGFIADSLEKVKHTPVKVSEAEKVPAELMPAPKETAFIVPSLRLDGVIAKVYNLSRKEAQDAVKAGLVFVNSRAAAGGTYQLSEGDLVSVRGHGRFRFKGAAGETHKGNIRILAEVY